MIAKALGLGGVKRALKKILGGSSLAAESVITLGVVALVFGAVQLLGRFQGVQNAMGMISNSEFMKRLKEIGADFWKRISPKLEMPAILKSFLNAFVNFFTKTKDSAANFMKANWDNARNMFAGAAPAAPAGDAPAPDGS